VVVLLLLHQLISLDQGERNLSSRQRQGTVNASSKQKREEEGKVNERSNGISIENESRLVDDASRKR
jgi:hypothetical protein